RAPSSPPLLSPTLRRPPTSTLFPYTTLFRSTLVLTTAPGAWPECVTVNWRRLSSGLWRVREGDIHAAYSAENFPRVAVFIHEGRSEEHTSELQSRFDLVCRLLLEKKKKEIEN